MFEGQKLDHGHKRTDQKFVVDWSWVGQLDERESAIITDVLLGLRMSDATSMETFYKEMLQKLNNQTCIDILKEWMMLNNSGVVLLFVKPDWWPSELEYMDPEEFDDDGLRNAVFIMLRKAGTENFREALAPLKTRSVDLWVLRLALLLTQIESSSLDELKALAASFVGFCQEDEQSAGDTIDTPHIPVTSGSPDGGVSRRLSRMLATTPSRIHLAVIMACTVLYDVQLETSLNQACLRDLRTTNPHHNKDRIQNTNGGLLKDSYCWILDNEEFQQWQNNQSNCLLWIRGDPGKGKTMLLCGIIDELTQLFGDTANISFFFCQATDARINNATAVLRGLIYSLVKKDPSLLSHDINAWNALFAIFTDILKDPSLQSIFLIIDALDECITGLPSLLDLITQVSSAYQQIKWIVSSRNWPDIEERLEITQTALISLELNEAEETRDTIYRHLLSNSTPRRHAIRKLDAFPPGLHALYGRMIDQVRNSEDAESCKRILAVMSIVYRPVAFDELASLVELPDDLAGDSEALLDIIAICGSFLTVREDTIIFVH
ncbi:unnamed protein product [Penicillium salamii]|nr:unnamed protein product [Penicillium salamii]CAG8428792.1 unnamed protein product [Penicillium salamii]